MNAEKMSLWRIEYMSGGRFYVEEITAPTLLDCIVQTLDVHPDADFARVVCVATSWSDGDKKKT